ncbi:glycoside hydrolase family 55 protein [Labilibaculum sp. DW002]|uniref:Glycoside hydrolase family 55 protein n=1 Tax=Paralabilibaculum antarcticum TaxID=2912572 RepID=A0ABT5VNS2_9BACT|nr:glycosyl hydrolase family 28-related protein [Labilibaculum sp. DW002]MDE5417081.1 glycoside hydrolase family 55 protein [Labilibaculum sp. DW002]
MRNLFILFTLIILGSSCQNSEQDKQPKILQDFIQNGSKSILPDFSYAGYEYGEKEIPNSDAIVFDVSEYGAIPNDNIDDTKSIQAAIDAAGANQGGIVFFPPGTFHVNMDTTKLDIIRINYSNIVMRGSGSNSTGTTIFSGSATTQAANNSPWLSPFVFHTGLNLFGTDRFYSIDEEPVFAQLTADLLKGEAILQLEKTDGLKSGNILLIAMSNTTDDGDLMKNLMDPLEYDPFQTSYINAGRDRKSSFQWSVEIDKVINNKEVLLKQPSRRDIKTKFNARVAIMPMLRNIGIENFRFDCAYKGGYGHHKTREHDYGWGAICMHRVSHAWVRNIDINNYTQNTHLVNSRNVTISNISMSGLNGHYGPKMYHSNDNLVQDITINALYTHGPGLEGASFGNVYRNIQLAHPSPIDLHGIGGPDFCPPMYNLYENISNLTKLGGGGATTNIPHAGEYNTFWGLQLASFNDDDFNELFYSWIWRDAKRFNNEFHIDCHKQYLRSIMVGIHNPNKELSIEHKTEDRNDEWIYVEGLNQNMNLPSLYETQLKLRLNK